MKEMHAYLNTDGTYTVDIIAVSSRTVIQNGLKVREETELKINIPKASISITAYESGDPDGTLVSIQMK